MGSLGRWALGIRADVIHLQGDKVDVGTVNTGNKQHYNGDEHNYYRLDQQEEVGSQLHATSDINIISKNHTALRQANVHRDDVQR